MFEEMEVGAFDESELPQRPGRCRYEPYRGPGHHDMQEHLLAGRSPRCYYDADDIRVSFSVRSCPDYGVLEIFDVETEPRPAA